VKVLVAGGAGFIGSTVASACLDNGIMPVVLDNLVTGRVEFTRDRVFYRGDISDGAVVDAVFAEHRDIAAVIHTATITAWPDSGADRLVERTVAESRSFVDHVVRNGCDRYLYSSSAVIYRPDADRSVSEASDVEPTGPYGRAKVAIEQMLADRAAAGDLRVLSLRYFEPIGADPQLRSGPHDGRPAQLVEEILAAAHRDEEFVLAGALPTRDGSAIRDFIHVWDIADAHVAAVRRFDKVLPVRAGWSHDVINLGTGRSTTVKEFLSAFRSVSELAVRVRETPSGPGHPVGSFTRSVRARDMLGWTPQFSTVDGIRHAMQWAAVRPSVLGA
jgi:UDP-glucose 4-epimerase